MFVNLRWRRRLQALLGRGMADDGRAARPSVRDPAPDPLACDRLYGMRSGTRSSRTHATDLTARDPAPALFARDRLYGTPSGNMIGLPAIYEGNITFPYSVATYVNCSVELIDISVFKQILSQNAKFAFRILSILNENTAQTYGRFFCISQKQLHGRLADILLCLARRVFGNNSFELPLSRNDLAELTGMSTESVIRIMKDFKDDGLISSCGKSFEILDFARLYKISEVG